MMTLSTGGCLRLGLGVMGCFSPHSVCPLCLLRTTAKDHVTGTSACQVSLLIVSMYKWATYVILDTGFLTTASFVNTWIMWMPTVIQVERFCIVSAHLSLHSWCLPLWLFCRLKTLWAKNSLRTTLHVVWICCIYCSFVLCAWSCLIKSVLTSICVSLPSFSGNCVSRSHRCCCSVSLRAEQKLLKALGPRFGRSCSKRKLRFWAVCSA